MVNFSRAALLAVLCLVMACSSGNKPATSTGSIFHQ